MEVTCYTVSDSRYFLGTVLLLNSLRLTNGDVRLVVLDRGLTSEQRSRLEEHADVVDIRVEDDQMSDWVRSNLGYYLKPYPAFLDPKGIVIALDSDVIVTDSLKEPVSYAAAGKICVWEDLGSDRWFAEWQRIFSLDAMPRKQPYVGSGFVAASATHWPDLFQRWWDIGSRVQGPHEAASFPDQDALNALLATDIPEGAVATLSTDRVGWAPPDSVVVEDPARLRCSKRGTRTLLLHYNPGLGQPKPWERRAWMYVRRSPFVQLMPRLLFGDDVALGVSPREAPVWLRPGLFGRALFVALSLLNRLGRFVIRLRR